MRPWLCRMIALMSWGVIFERGPKGARKAMALFCLVVLWTLLVSLPC